MAQNILKKNKDFIMAQILSNEGRHAEAKLLYQSLLLTFKENHLIHLNLGVTDFVLGDFIQAEKLLKTAINLNKKSFTAYYALGNTLVSLNRADEALLAYDQGIAIEPSYPDIYNDKGLAEMSLLRFDDARCSFEKSTKLDPQFKDAINNLGITLSHLNLYKEACQAFESAIELDAHFYLAHLNLGLALQFLGELKGALKSFNRALELNPNDDFIKWNKSNLLLLMGQYEEGWQLYESRWTSVKKNDVRNFKKPLWLGEESLESKTILIHAEQGFGDVIQFSRYIPHLGSVHTKIIFEVQASLVSLMKSLPCKNLHVIARGDDIPEFDYHCPMMSLPLAFKTAMDSIPDDIPYLYPSANKLKEIDSTKKIKVGVVWSGSKTLFHTHHRSIDLENFSKIFNEKIDFHVLQKEIDISDLNLLKNISNVFLHQNEIHSFEDTAALIDQMDLVITIDTSVAHLAGALAKKTFLLLPFVPDFRWFTKGAASPWYPTMQLFRQTEGLNWNGVIEEVAFQLKNYLNTR